MTIDGALIPPAEVASRLGPAALAHLEAFRARHPSLPVEGPVRLRDALAEWSSQGIPTARVEGDPELAGAAFDQDLVDHVLCIVSPTLASGPHSAPAVGGAGVASMAEAWQVEPCTWMRLGDDLVAEGPVARPGATPPWT